MLMYGIVKKSSVRLALFKLKWSRVAVYGLQNGIIDLTALRQKCLGAFLLVKLRVE